jgi:hypothetical protein
MEDTGAGDGVHATARIIETFRIHDTGRAEIAQPFRADGLVELLDCDGRYVDSLDVNAPTSQRGHSTVAASDNHDVPALQRELHVLVVFHGAPGDEVKPIADLPFSVQGARYALILKLGFGREPLGILARFGHEGVKLLELSGRLARDLLFLIVL